MKKKNDSIYLKLRSPMRNIMQPLTNSSIWISLRQNGFILTIAHQTNCFTSNSLRIVARIISAEFLNVTIIQLEFSICRQIFLWNRQLFLRFWPIIMAHIWRLPISWRKFVWSCSHSSRCSVATASISSHRSWHCHIGFVRTIPTSCMDLWF